MIREQTFRNLLYDIYKKWIHIECWEWFCSKSQQEKVWWHLKTFGSITNLICRNVYGIAHTPKIIMILRNNPKVYGDGRYRIDSIREKGKDRWGKNTNWVRYTLVDLEEQNV